MPCRAHIVEARRWGNIDDHYFRHCFLAAWSPALLTANFSPWMTVESIFRFEGNGRIKEYPGNHSAFLEARKREAPEPGEAKTTVSRPAPVAGTPAGPRKLSYNERREFEELEKRIEVAEARKVELERLLAASSSDLVAVEAAYVELQSLNRELEKDVDRWAALAVVCLRLGSI